VESFFANEGYLISDECNKSDISETEVKETFEVYE
jgi:hypothetical protein